MDTLLKLFRAASSIGIAAILGILPGQSVSQTFTGTGGPIPDNGTPAHFYLPVTGVTPPAMDTVYGLESVEINITHTWDEDLLVELISPNGTVIVLTDGIGGNLNNYTMTVFTDDASLSIFAGTPPYTGDFRPMENIGYQNTGQPANGTWDLRITDKFTGDAGTLLNWTLIFSPNPGRPFQFDSSGLALVVLDTYGQEIPDDPKILAGMKIIDNANGNYNHLTDPAVYDSYAGIELRGATSQLLFPKKSYGLETWDSLQNEVDTSLLGMPKESDWILNAGFSDKTLMRNALAYQTWMNLGHYATRYRFVELILNNRYKGVYLFSEKIKRDNNRVDIAKLTPSMNSGDSLTGGYIIKIDKVNGSGGEGWTSQYPPPVNQSGQTIFFQYEYPKANDITDQQKAYIQDYVDIFEDALAGPSFADTALGFRKYAVEETFIDYFIENEFSKNVDAYRLSTFVHKERDSRGGKLRMGPAWDYDLAWHNANYCGAYNANGWAYQFPCFNDFWQVPFWWERLLEDTLYANNLKCRWYEIRNTFLSNETVNNWIDSIAGVLDGPQQRNFECWPILGVQVWPNPSPIPTTYESEVDVLKNWIDLRFTWLDANMPGNCGTQSVYPGPGKGRLQIAPNPAGNTIVISGVNPVGGTLVVDIYSLQGQRLMMESGYIPGQRLDVSGLSPGSYFIRVNDGDGIFPGKFIKL